jgi:hypothetical protein
MQKYLISQEEVEALTFDESLIHEAALEVLNKGYMFPNYEHKYFELIEDGSHSLAECIYEEISDIIVQWWNELPESQKVSEYENDFDYYQESFPDFSGMFIKATELICEEFEKVFGYEISQNNEWNLCFTPKLDENNTIPNKLPDIIGSLCVPNEIIDLNNLPNRVEGEVYWYFGERKGKSLSGIGKKYLTYCWQLEITHWINSSILGICFIKGLKEVPFSIIDEYDEDELEGEDLKWYQALTIMQKYFNQARVDDTLDQGLVSEILDIQEALISAGLKEFAKL